MRRASVTEASAGGEIGVDEEAVEVGQVVDEEEVSDPTIAGLYISAYRTHTPRYTSRTPICR